MRLTLQAQKTLFEAKEAGGELHVTPDGYWNMDAVDLEKVGLVKVHDAGTWGIYSSIELTAKGREFVGLPPLPGKLSLKSRMLRCLDRIV